MSKESDKSETRTKHIYLDTSHLQKWVQNELPSKEIDLLNKIKNSETIFIFSFVHIYEISENKDTKLIQNIAHLIETLPCKWIKHSAERFHDEIKYAHNSFLGGKENPQNPFVKRAFETLIPSVKNSLEIALDFSQASLNEIFLYFHNNPTKKLYDSLREILPFWASNNAQQAKEKSNAWKKEVNNTFRAKLEKRVNAPLYIPELRKEHYDDFINHLISNPDLTKSYLTPFYIQHAIHKNTQKKWDQNDFGDLEHCSAIPYVDMFSCDAQTFNYTQIARKNFIQLNFLKTKISDNLSELLTP